MNKFYGPTRQTIKPTFGYGKGVWVLGAIGDGGKNQGSFDLLAMIYPLRRALKAPLRVTKQERGTQRSLRQIKEDKDTAKVTAPTLKSPVRRKNLKLPSTDAAGLMV
jgi:hypothetical protein